MVTLPVAGSILTLSEEASTCSISTRVVLRAVRDPNWSLVSIFASTFPAALATLSALDHGSS